MTRDQIVVVTNQDDPHADFVIRTLLTMGHEPIRLNTDEIPLQTLVALDLCDRWAGRIELQASGRLIDVGRIRSVWWRRPGAYRLPDDLSPFERSFASDELDHAFRGLWAELDCYWMSDPDAIQRAGWKLGQLQRAVRLGFDVPRTLVTSEPRAALEFHRACGGEVVFKVMTGPFMGAERYVDRNPEALPPPALQTQTTVVGEAELEDLEAIRTVPCLFQELVPKRVELRVTVIGDQVFAAEIDSQADDRTLVDWRAAFDGIAYRATELPPQVRDRCLAMVRGYGLNYSAIDLILTPDDRYVFLESNPNGQFRFVEELVPELPLTDAVAACLARGLDD